MFNMIEDLFSPGRKHTHEEQKRLELSRVDVEDGDPGRGPIDLASGKVTIRAKAPADTETDTGTDAGPEAEPAAEAAPASEAEPEAESQTEPQTQPQPPQV